MDLESTGTPYRIHLQCIRVLMIRNFFLYFSNNPVKFMQCFNYSFQTNIVFATAQGFLFRNDWHLSIFISIAMGRRLDEWVSSEDLKLKARRNKWRSSNVVFLRVHSNASSLAGLLAIQLVLLDSETARVDVSLVILFWSNVFMLRKPMPSAFPAAMAAPRAVVSVSGYHCKRIREYLFFVTYCQLVINVPMRIRRMSVRN